MVAITVLVLTVLVLTVSGCSSQSSTKDERPWFRSYVADVTSNLLRSPEFGMQPPPSPYVGQCQDHASNVSWQASLEPKPQQVGNLDRPGPRNEDIDNLLGRLELGIPAADVEVIHPSAQSAALTDTAVLKPANGSRVQVSVPDPQTVLVVGFVGC